MLQLKEARKFSGAAIVVGLVMAQALTARAIELDLVDDFQDGTSQNWGFASGGGLPVDNAANAGPSGVGDHALFSDSDSGEHGVGKLIVINSQRWSGDWTSAGATRVALDVRNPNATPLAMRLGVVGAGGVNMGNGDGHVTDAISVPADDQWHSIVFDVLASDLTAIGGTSTGAALANVKEARIFSNPLVRIIGQNGGAFYLDNIRALGADLGIAGDYNSDGVVDAADYTVWRDSSGQTGSGLAADGTGAGGAPDGVVDDLDYAFWKTHFGADGGGHHHGLGGATTVPEPGALTAFVLGFVAIVAFGRRKKEPAN